MNARRSFQAVCPHCKRADCNCFMSLVEAGFELQIQAMRRGFGLLGETADRINQMVKGKCGCCSCGPVCNCNCSCSCHREKELTCGCCRCGPECRCDCTCPCHLEKRFFRHPAAEKWHANIDIPLVTRLGERRIIPFLVENNRPRKVEITFRSGPWIDASGQELNNIPVAFDPPKASLESGESVAVKATLNINAPLAAGMTYFTEFILEGCPARPISVGVWVKHEGAYAHYAVCDPCRRRKGRFLEFCHDPCADNWGAGGFGVDGCDPHRHWFDECGCTWHYLPKSARPRLLRAA